MSHFAIMRLHKVHDFGHIAGLNKHLERERETRNADPERTPLNERLAGSGDWVADVQARLAVAPIVRKNAVLAIEHVCTASPEWFATGTAEQQAQRRGAWRDASMAWMRSTYGSDNVVAAILHRDETTPHIQALVVPIDERGRLNSRGFIGGTRARLVELQDSYAASVASLGLERGVCQSVANHEEIRHWYAQMREVPVGAREIAAAVEIEPPGHVVARPQEYAQEQRLRVLTVVAPRVEAMARQVGHLSRKVERQELQIVAQSQREQESRALLAHLRQVDLGTVMTALGGERDPSDRHRWHLGGEAISVDGECWRNLTRQQNGTGAIELVTHAQPGYDYRQAIAWMRDQVGEAAAVVAAARDAQAITRSEPSPPFRAPEPDPQRWPQVRTYLVEQRDLPGQWVDALHQGGKVYADSRGNAVFLHQYPQGKTTGAYLRGTAPESTLVGPAAGTRRDAGWFTASLPCKREAGQEPPTLIVAKSPIDALSVLELYRRFYRDGSATGPVMVVSTEAGALPHQAIRDTLGRGGMVRVATDGSQSGERVWQQIRENYPEPQVRRDCPALKDWNEVLRWANVVERDPKRADRELHEMWRQNAQDDRSRTSLRETVRRWAPDREPGRDGYAR